MNERIENARRCWHNAARAHEHGVGQKVVYPGSACGSQPAEMVDLEEGGGSEMRMGAAAEETGRCT